MLRANYIRQREKKMMVDCPFMLLVMSKVKNELDVSFILYIAEVMLCPLPLDNRTSNLRRWPALVKDV